MKLSILYNINETTRPYTQKIIDPALMTYQEYRDVVDPDHKLHPSDAYDTNLEELNRYQSPEDYDTLVNTITRHNLRFEIRKKTIDRWNQKYTKTTPDGKIIRDETGSAMYMSSDEIKTIIPEDQRYRYEYGIIEVKSNKIVANTQDEWGTMLLMTAREYRKFGFGTILAKLALQARPDRSSGGFTNAGINTFGRVHDEMVREYLSSGFYSYLVKTKQITANRAKAIISGIQPRKTHPKRNLDTSNPQDWLLLTDGSSYSVLYDKKIYELDDIDSDDVRHWVDRHIIGIVSIASYGSDVSPWVNRAYGRDKIKAFLLTSLLQMEPGQSIRMNQSEAELTKSVIGNDLIEVPSNRPGDSVAYYTNTTNPVWNHMMNQERKYRKTVDPYGEWFSRILSWAENLGDDY